MTQEKIKEEAEKVLEELSLTLGEVELEETYYVLKDVNVLRDDSTPENKKEFRKLALKNAPKIDEDSYFIAEVGTWAL
ncbi:MAG TPA: Asp-tRNA(Asn) amidotransferase subunit GatC [Euryarchaeota archaeon]|nr:aspartyl/glutamyl-tRNA amidotransferase subunit C [archaeon BMS3Bbin15]HDL15204.1 Asp-tRNA(Asn) amidotransferase subunit GatC [Euryarchaeota archaeon]